MPEHTTWDSTPTDPMSVYLPDTTDNRQYYLEQIFILLLKNPREWVSLVELSVILLNLHKRYLEYLKYGKVAQNTVLASVSK